ncbi:MAG: precorrin-2 C(20)-methyltransferase [Desulfobacteraceae bacterium]|nr:precorrin-2 C(20)-methyltransferase [Desulfobacteraceae bacterium]
MMTTGTLFGIGVGPGDPELIPVKSVRVLAEVDKVFTAASTRNDYSLAVDIVRSYIPEKTPVETLAFPMSNDQNVKEEAWKKHAVTIADYLEKGMNAAFLTLGDPLTYSTYGYILRFLNACAQDIKIRTIPGITSYQAAAAATNRPLVEGDESLLVLSGVQGGNRLKTTDPKPDNVVFMKAYRNIHGICEALDDAGLIEGSIGISHCSRAEEKVHTDVCSLAEAEPNYWTLIIANRNRANAESDST